MGYKLGDPEYQLPTQKEVAVNGFALQCRVTTEDPTNQFRPDYGKIKHYRSSGGMGIRLDAGSAFSGAVVNPFYDSLLVKVTARGRSLKEAAARMERALQEFRIRGVKTNIPFLVKMVTNGIFLSGQATTRLIDNTPDLVELPKRRDRATRLLTYLAETIVNGNELVKGRLTNIRRQPAPVPKLDTKQPMPRGTRDLLKELGPVKFSQWVREQKSLLLTDTTMRDAHQSLLATRLRTYDMLQIAEAYARLAPQFFSLEMWVARPLIRRCGSSRKARGLAWSRCGKRFPTFCSKCCSDPATQLATPTTPTMSLRCLSKRPRMLALMSSEFSMRSTGLRICESPWTRCWSRHDLRGRDLLHRRHSKSQTPKYNLKYYVDLAKQLEKMGAHMLAIKDMAGLLKPAAAKQLVRALRQEIGIPIHFHTHDTAGIQAASILAAAEEDLDIADGAMASMSGGTSQVNLNTLVEALRFGPYASELSTEVLTELSNYWKAVREFYQPFESEALAASGDLYEHEMPVVSTPTCISRLTRWACPIVGLRFVTCMPKSIRCLAISSR